MGIRHNVPADQRRLLDLYDGKVLGWVMSAGSHARETAVATLEMAVRNRTPLNSLIFHSDRGIQYCTFVFGKFWAGYVLTFVRA